MGFNFHNNQNEELIQVNLPYIENYIKNELLRLIEKNKSRQVTEMLNIKTLKRCLV